MNVYIATAIYFNYIIHAAIRLVNSVIFLCIHNSMNVKGIWASSLESGRPHPRYQYSHRHVINLSNRRLTSYDVGRWSFGTLRLRNRSLILNMSKKNANTSCDVARLPPDGLRSPEIHLSGREWCIKAGVTGAWYNLSITFILSLISNW
jgi:hypothetical protein